MAASITLVNTNTIEPLVAPIGLDYVAQALADDGWDVQVLDLALALPGGWSGAGEDMSGVGDGGPRAAIRADIASHQPAVVGVTFRNTDDCYLGSRHSFLPHLKEVVDAVRASTDAPVVLGGVGFSVMPEAVLEAVGLDIGVWGEGEASLGQLARRLAAGEPIGDIPNLVFRDSDGWRRTAVSYTDLGSLPSRTRSFIDNRAYFERGGQGSIETKRGCDQNCICCADPVSKGREQRLRAPQAVADEIEALLGQGVDCLHTCDSEFNLPEHHARAVCEAIIARGLGDQVRWYAYASPAPFSAELAKLMCSAGCVGIDFGVDSGSDAQLARLGRRHRTTDLTATADACRRAGITFMYDLLLGGPGETRETIAETIGLMKKIEPDRVGVSVGVRLYPGTPIARMVEREGFTETNPTLFGQVEGNPSMLHPVFYISEHLGEDIWPVVSELVGDDARFFFTDPTRPEQNYNYNDNSLLVQAIADGHRGAYWDILRRLEAR